MKSEIDIPAIVAQLSRYPEIAATYLFGSAARGELRAESDVDLGLVLRDRRTVARDCYRMLGDLANRLEGAVGGRALDLVVLDAQGPIFRHRVVSSGRMIYEADLDRRIDFESETYSLYFDFLPTYELATAGQLAGVQTWLDQRR